MTPRLIPDLIDIEQELFELPPRVIFYCYNGQIAVLMSSLRSGLYTTKKYRLQQYKRRSQRPRRRISDSVSSENGIKKLNAPLENWRKSL